MEHSAKLIPLVIALCAGSAMPQAGGDKRAVVTGSKPAGREVFINLADRTMTIKQGDMVLASYPIAIGRAGYPTPVGEFRVIDKDVNPTGTPDVSARWLGFVYTMNKDGPVELGIHGTENTRSIGRPASHGCIRLRIPDAIEAFALLSIGDPIHIIGPPHRRRTIHHDERKRTSAR